MFKLLELLIGTETWPMKSDVPYIFCQNYRAMIRWICGVKPNDGPSMADLHEKLGLCDLKDAICVRRLRWYGHVMRHEEKEIHNVRPLRPKSGRPKTGRPKKTWQQYVDQDLRVSKLKKSLVFDRHKWNESLWKGQLAPTPSLMGSALQAMGDQPRLVG